MTPDRELLVEFANSRSESAFRTLVDRHLDLVHSVARRVTLNDDLARDVSQSVFTKLASDPRSAPANLNLLSWLHRTTRHKAIDLVRSENRRKRRERIAHQEEEMTRNEPEIDWKELEPVIDDALSKLSEGDRSLILARFYQRRTHASTASDLGITEDAARVRTSRALEKLRRVLGKRGVTTTAAALAVILPAQAVSAAPLALAGTISSSALAATATGATAAAGGGAIASFLMTAKSQIAAIAAVAVAAPVIAYQYSENSNLEERASLLEDKLASVAHAQALDAGGVRLKSGGNKAGLSTSDLDSSKSLRQILAQRDPMSRIRDLLQYADKLKSHEIPAALKEVRESAPDWDLEGRMFAHMLLMRWGKEDAETAFASLNNLDLLRAGVDATSILSGVAANDPGRALAWLNDPTNGYVNLPMVGQIFAGTVAKEWVRQDPEAALRWARSLPTSQRKGAFGGILESLASSDPERASTMALELDAAERGEVVGDIARSWALSSPRAALRWAEDLVGKERRLALGEALNGWARSAPEEVIAYLETMSEEDRSVADIASIAGSWARRAPGDAAGWITSREEGTGKNEAMRQLMLNWTSRDPQAASRWIDAQPESESRDHGIAMLAFATFETDPESAVTWAAEMNNPEMRRTSLDKGIHLWLARDSAAARAWLKNTNILSAEERLRYAGD